MTQMQNRDINSPVVEHTRCTAHRRDAAGDDKQRLVLHGDGFEEDRASPVDHGGGFEGDRASPVDHIVLTVVCFWPKSCKLRGSS